MATGLGNGCPKHGNESQEILPGIEPQPEPNYKSGGAGFTPGMGVRKFGAGVAETFRRGFLTEERRAGAASALALLLAGLCLASRLSCFKKSFNSSSHRATFLAAFLAVRLSILKARRATFNCDLACSACLLVSSALRAACC